ncbi:hypothetical protein VKT23_016203 [Stygiomarasmius scandens]|uniref:Uncharacterized protein n=1 Tax=Marasmiellus scandens TaxID=2682957 RepID=A0ABR1IVD7_9AGAR
MEDSDSDVESDPPPPPMSKHSSQKKARSHVKTHSKNAQEDDASEDSKASDVLDLDNEQGDNDAQRLFNEEAPQFVSCSRGRKESVVFSDDNVDQDPNGVDNSGAISVPTTSDSEGLSSDISQDEEEEIEEIPPPKSKSKTTLARAQWFEREWPIISNTNLPTSRATGTQAGTMSNAIIQSALNPSSNSDIAPAWLPRTEIVLKPHTDATCSYTIGMHSQILEMKAVIRLTQKIGLVKMVSDVTYCPLTTEGLEDIATASLIEAAKELGYDSEGDVAHCMESGEMDKYIKPLKAYMRFLLI